MKDLNDATGSMLKVFTARNRRERLNDERMRQDVEAKQLRSEARMIKAGEDLTATKQRMQPAPQRMLGAGSDRPNIKQFVFEEEDEVQELRIHDKQGTLLKATMMARAQAEELGQDIEKDNVLIASMTERVCDSEPTQLARQRLTEFTERSSPRQANGNTQPHESDPVMMERVRTASLCTFVRWLFGGWTAVAFFVFLMSRSCS